MNISPFKRYMVFTGSIYYPAMGMRDFATSFNDKEQALAYCNGFLKSNTLIWAQIFDTEQQEIFFEEDSR